eukprot:scaffold28633_cov61-Phaeocystis_antarctica.AAC.7
MPRPARPMAALYFVHLVLPREAAKRSPADVTLLHAAEVSHVVFSNAQGWATPALATRWAGEASDRDRTAR